MTPKRGTRLIGYLRCSTEEQAMSGLGLSAQLEAITRACEYEGYDLVGTETAVVSGGVKQPAQLMEVMARVEADEADGLIVSHLDRLYRSSAGFERLIEWSESTGRAVVILDPRIDTTDPMGLLMARIGMAFAELERKRIGTRTRQAMAVKKARGEQVGRAEETDPKHRKVILELAGCGHSFREIARTLNERGMLRRNGVQWHHHQVARVVARNES